MPESRGINDMDAGLRRHDDLNQRFPMDRQPCVYMLASKRNGTLYTGVTSNLVRRVWEHRNNVIQGFTHKYGVHDLVWYEVHETMESAIQREKRIKNWKREWKIKAIETVNPGWRDLYADLL
jgi:putative endonuclease